MKYLGYLPIFVSLLFISIYPFSSELYLILVQEDHFFEWLTVAFAFAGGIIAMVLAVQSYRAKDLFNAGLLAFYAMACIFFGGEEISWGQRIFGINVEESIPWLAKVNKADELTLHNIELFDRLRNIADLFCVLWGIIIPIYYRKRLFPIAKLAIYLSPLWMIPSYLSYVMITWPQKGLRMVYGKEQWIQDLRLGEIKELIFGMIIFLFIVHLVYRFKEKIAESPQLQSVD